MYLVADAPIDELEQQGTRTDGAHPLVVVADSLRRSTAKQLALDQVHVRSDLDDGIDVGW